MKQLTDYIFSNSWQQEALNLKPGDVFHARQNLDQVKAGSIVTFMGFVDVDNHYGIMVFKDDRDQLLEISGDFCSITHSTPKLMQEYLIRQ